MRIGRGRNPAAGAVALVALQCGHKVRNRFARSRGAVMTGGTGPGGTGMVETGRNPGQSRMAGIAG